MGTRSLTVVCDSETKLEILTLYAQWDGYPKHHGRLLLKFLRGFQIVNGIGSYNSPEKQANGPGCLAAQIVAHFKRRKPKTKNREASGPIGGFYLEPTGTRNAGEEYIYKVIVSASDFVVEIQDGNGKLITSGNPTQLLKWISKSK